MKTQAILLLSLTGVLVAQAARNAEIPLKNWPAALYWQPTPAQTEATELRAEIRTPTPEAATPAGALVFVAVTPCRVVDTRASQNFAVPFGAPSLTPGPARSFPIQSSTVCAIPSAAQAYSFNVTVVPPGPLGFLTLWPTGQAQPNAVTLDDVPGQIVNNAAIVPAGTENGSISAVVNGTTDLVIDINGYYVPSTGVTLAQGTVAIPSLSFSGDTGTGIFSPGNGILDFTSAGTNALTVGGTNTAIGKAAFNSNTTGTANTASGFQALFSNTTGASNTASGYQALYTNTYGEQNTASGYQSLFTNTTGNNNTASGYYALDQNTNGSGNVASGAYALYTTNTGSLNVGSGQYALYSNTTGSNNTALGYNTLVLTNTGNNNTALGSLAGENLTGNSSNNIDIGNQGGANDVGVIRIGTTGTQTSFFAAGVRGVITGANDGVPVMIDSNGQLGTVNSSRRFKQDIQDMAGASTGLLRLRPVTYRYRQPYADGSQPLDYGLIAEEVAEVYPDLVVKGADGQIETVQYQKLTPMLLNELQKLRSEFSALQAEQKRLQDILRNLTAGQVQ